uniref:Uncharacterized protein n=1 Tax=Megaselia scalaris TaxID=36166 RepID=T1GZ80_MEGSC
MEARWVDLVARDAKELGIPNWRLSFLYEIANKYLTLFEGLSSTPPSIKNLKTEIRCLLVAVNTTPSA